MAPVNKRTFFVVLLLVSLLVPIPSAAAKAPEPQLIAGNELVYNPEPDWSLFWSKFNQYSQWDLEYYDGVQWVSCKGDLEIVRDYPEPNHVKLTLIFDASHKANYRLTFAIDRIVQNYTTRLSEYAYELNYGNYSLVWDWSDAVAIPGLVFTHGLLNDMFWFRMRRDNVPLGAHVVIDPSLIASYPTANQDDEKLMDDIHPSATGTSAVGQSFQNRAVDTNITSVKFYLRDTGGTADGNLIAALYAHSGTYGTNSKPTGVALATSDPIAANGLGVGFALYEFTFPAGQRYGMTANSYYTIFVYRTGTTGTVRVGTDSSGPSHGGNYFYYNSGAWVSNSGVDTIFYLYGMSPPTVDSYSCDALFTQNDQEWFNATVSDPDLVANLATVDIAVTMNLNNTFTLRWTQATGVFSEVSDPDGVCTLNTTDSVRTSVDVDTDIISFLFALTGGTEGNCDVVVTATDDDALTDVETYATAFVYAIYDWDPVKLIIDSAFALFGVTGFLNMSLTYIATVGSLLSISFINLALLIVQQFRLILAVFGWLINGFTGIVTTILDLGTIAYSLIDGTYTAGMVNLWTEFNLASMTDVILLLLVFMWLDSIVSRGKVTPGGEIAVFIGDVSMAINISSYFMSMFQTIIESVIGRVYGLIQALP